jgi:hypothetical protein
MLVTPGSVFRPSRNLGRVGMPHRAMASSLRRVPHDRRRVVRVEARQWREVAGVVHHDPEQAPDSFLIGGMLYRLHMRQG